MGSPTNHIDTMGGKVQRSVSIHVLQIELKHRLPEKRCHAISMALFGGVVQRGAALVILGVRIGLGVHQLSHREGPALSRCHRDRRAMEAIEEVDIGLAVQQQANQLRVAVVGREVKRALAAQCRVL